MNLHASYDRLIHYWVDIFEARWIRDGLYQAETWANSPEG